MFRPQDASQVLDLGVVAGQERAAAERAAVQMAGAAGGSGGSAGKEGGKGCGEKGNGEKGGGGKGGKH